MKALRESTLGIVGLGLMGGSLALALRAGNVCRRIIGVTRNARTRQAALERGVVDAAGDELGLLAEADVIVLATPVRKIIEQLPRVGAIARAGAVIMDFGSTKRDILRVMQDLPLSIEPIGAHPMCGKETSGYESADAGLYRNAVFVLTPLERTSPQTLALAQSLARALGARPLMLGGERHDRAGPELGLDARGRRLWDTGRRAPPLPQPRTGRPSAARTMTSRVVDIA